MYAAGQDPRLVLPPRGPPEHRRDPHLPPDRPAAAAVVRQGPAQRGPGRHHRAGAQPGRPLRRRSRSTPRRCPPSSSGLPFSGPIGGVRVALIDGQWVGVPEPLRARARRLRHGRRRPVVVGPTARGRRDHDGRGRGHRGRLEPDQDRGRARRPPRRSSPRASRPPSRSSPSCAPRSRSWPQGRQADRRSSRCSSTTRTTRTPPSRPRPRPTSTRRSRSPTSRSARARLDEIKDARQGRARPSSSRAARRSSRAAFRSLTKKLVRQRILRDKVRIDGRGLRRHPPARRPRSRCCRACTARRCSSAARPRSWASPR